MNHVPLSGKHPVSALMEICNKKKWAPPEFIMVHHSGPDHRKNFLFKVGMFHIVSAQKHMTVMPSSLTMAANR